MIVELKSQKLWGEAKNKNKKKIEDINKFKKLAEDFPGGPGVENPPANAGDMDWTVALWEVAMILPIL